MLLRGFLHPLGLVAAPLAQRLPPHPFRQPQRLLAGRVEPPRRGTGICTERLHHVLEGDRHVPFDVRVGEIPAARPGNHLKHPLPALTLGEVHHAAEQPAIGPHTEQRRRQDFVEVRIARGVIFQDHVARLARVRVPEVRSKRLSQ